VRYIWNRYFPARYRSPAGRRKLVKKLLIAVLLLLFSGETVAEIGLFSVSQELTETAARSYLLSQMSQAVNEELQAEKNVLVAIDRAGSGEISAVSANTTALNALKAGVLSRLEKSLNGTVTAWIPVGSLTEIGVFNGRGPKVPVKLKLETSADISFQTEFRSAGVNQSCHRITMAVTARAYSQSQRFEALVEEHTETVLAETVVVGEVPNVALTGK